MASRPLEIVIPGEPFAQPRPRARRMGRFVHIYEPKEAKVWKGAARMAIVQAIDNARADLMQPAEGGLNIVFMSGPVEVVLTAVFMCPASDHRKDPRPRRWHAKRPDADNVAKAVLDAATGVLWTNDDQVARLTVEKWIGAQGEAPYVQIRVWRLE